MVLVSCSADVVNRLTDDEIPRWAADHPILIRLPAYKFVLGVAGFLSFAAASSSAAAAARPAPANQVGDAIVRRCAFATAT